MNVGDPKSDLYEAELRVLEIQRKLHQWANDDTDRRFDDLYNLVCDPAFLAVAWERVRGNKGARSAGVDGVKPRSILFGSETLLEGLRGELKARTFRPLPVKERMIPKAGGKFRRLGIATARDRVVQASLKLVLEPIFEADFKPCSYGFRPNRRAHDAIAEIRQLAAHQYEWALEGDITACFDEISHSALMDRVRARVADRRVIGLVKAFLKAGILGEDGAKRDTITGTPQGGILSPLLSNIALSILDEHFAQAWKAMGTPNQRHRRRAKGFATYRIVRYADDFVVMVAGTKDHAEALLPEVAGVLGLMGLRLSESKTRIAHIDEGFDFLGWRIQRHQKRGTAKSFVYTYPAKKALASIVSKVRALTHRSSPHPTLAALIYRLNSVLRGWCAYFRYGVSSATFGYLAQFTWRRVLHWLRKRHPRTGWQTLRRRYLPGWRPTDQGASLLDPSQVTIIRYRYRGAAIPTPWTSEGSESHSSTAA